MHVLAIFASPERHLLKFHFPALFVQFDLIFLSLVRSKVVVLCVSERPISRIISRDVNKSCFYGMVESVCRPYSDKENPHSKPKVAERKFNKNTDTFNKTRAYSEGLDR